MGCSVAPGIMVNVGDILSTMTGVFSSMEGIMSKV